MVGKRAVKLYATVHVHESNHDVPVHVNVSRSLNETVYNQTKCIDARLTLDWLEDTHESRFTEFDSKHHEAFEQSKTISSTNSTVRSTWTRTALPIRAVGRRAALSLGGSTRGPVRKEMVAQMRNTGVASGLNVPDMGEDAFDVCGKKISPLHSG